MNRQIFGASASRNRIIFWFVVLTFFGIWPALSNGQPFFYADTTAYVRGADLAFANALGSRFATDWAKDQRRTIGTETSIPNPETAAAGKKSSRRAVLAGRSIIYGALLYLGEVSGGMWLSVIIQSFIATYLIFVFIVRTLGKSFEYFLASCFFLYSASSLPFFASYLMPDVFAGFLILGFAILATSWDRLSRMERVITGAVLLLAVLSHTTHLVLLLGLTGMTAGYVVLTARSQWINIRRLILVAVACVGIAVLWELMFSAGVRRALGGPPIRPPFVTAKLVSMLGRPAMAKVCASDAFVVCRFQDRFPVDAESFLWSEDERTGIFSVADVRTKRLLSDEQLRFALAVIPANVGRLVADASIDSLRQLTQFHLSEFFYSSSVLRFFENRLPSHDFDRMASTFAARSDAYVVFGRTVVYFTAVVGAIGTALLLWWMSRPGTVHGARETERTAWCVAAYILLTGVVLNAIICGGVSAINNRYQARVVWLVQLCLVTGICVVGPDWKLALFGNPNIGEYAPAYPDRSCEPDRNRSK
jgi:hypothetical protein